MPFGMGPGGPFGGPGPMGPPPGGPYGPPPRRGFGFFGMGRPPGPPPGGPYGPPPRRGCYIATAVYGSYDCPQVWTLRRYRDQVLDKNLFGKAFIKTYYTLSPLFLKYFGKNRFLMTGFRRFLDKKVTRLIDKGFSDRPYSDF